MMRPRIHGFVSFSALVAITMAGCSSSSRDPVTANAKPGDGPGGPGTPDLVDGGDDPCATVAGHSYIGCDAWPTPVANVVWSVFDFAVVVANAGDRPAEVVVERGGQVVAQSTVAANGLAKIYLPWVPELKGKDVDYCGSAMGAFTKSVRSTGGAYHLRSSRPVTVYQFNALEYAPAGGPSQKDWSSCPGNLGCPSVECFSYSNDASLLFPTQALTGHYRVTGVPSGPGNSYVAITATAPDTHVDFKPANGAVVVGGKEVADGSTDGTLHFTLNAGDVVELAAESGPYSDLSGSLITSDQPVQVIAGHPCSNVPSDMSACDHLEQSVVPAETLGKHYFVEQPTGPQGGIPGHVVRLYGNVDGTALTYPQGKPPHAPERIDAGQVVDLGVVSQDFEIVADHELAVITLMMGGEVLDFSGGEGDPSMSTVVAVEQYRTKYVFLAPDDYDISFVDAVRPLDATLTLDGKAIDAPANPIGASGFGVSRIRLGADASNTSSSASTGSHVLESNKPFGLQVLGYGKYTSYQYPGGLDLALIAPPPPK